MEDSDYANMTNEELGKLLKERVPDIHVEISDHNRETAIALLKVSDTNDKRKSKK
jgi:hypothetical protein